MVVNWTLERSAGVVRVKRALLFPLLAAVAKTAMPCLVMPALTPTRVLMPVGLLGAAFRVEIGGGLEGGELMQRLLVVRGDCGERDRSGEARGGGEQGEGAVGLAQKHEVVWRSLGDGS